MVCGVWGMVYGVYFDSFGKGNKMLKQTKNGRRRNIFGEKIRISVKETNK